MSPDPKPTPPIKATAYEWDRLRRELMPHRCRCFCGCERWADSIHHLVGRDQGGDDIAPNLVPLAGTGTTLCHGAVQYKQRTWDARRREYIDPPTVARAIRRNMEVHHVNYVIAKKGEEWLNRAYPRE